MLCCCCSLLVARYSRCVCVCVALWKHVVVKVCACKWRRLHFLLQRDRRCRPLQCLTRLIDLCAQTYTHAHTRARAGCNKELYCANAAPPRLPERRTAMSMPRCLLLGVLCKLGVHVNTAFGYSIAKQIYMCVCLRREEAASYRNVDARCVRASFWKLFCLCLQLCAECVTRRDATKKTTTTHEMKMRWRVCARGCVRWCVGGCYFALMERARAHAHTCRDSHTNTTRIHTC